MATAATSSSSKANVSRRRISATQDGEPPAPRKVQWLDVSRGRRAKTRSVELGTQVAVPPRKHAPVAPVAPVVPERTSSAREDPPQPDLRDALRDSLKALDRAASLVVDQADQLERENGGKADPAFAEEGIGAPSVAELLRRLEIRGDGGAVALKSKTAAKREKRLSSGAGGDGGRSVGKQVADEKDDLLEALRAELEAQVQENERLLEEFMDAKMGERLYVDDAYLARKWTSLQYKVEQLVATWYMPAAGGGDADQDVDSGGRLMEPTREFRDLTPRAEEYLAVPALRSYLVQAYIWSRLLYFVFSENGQLWAGDAHDAVGRTKSKLQHMGGRDLSVKGYEEWEANTASLLHSALGIDRGRVDAIASEMARCLRPYEAASDGKAGVTDQAAEAQLQALIRETAELDAELAKSRARYEIQMYDYSDLMRRERSFAGARRSGFRADPATMESAVPGMRLAEGTGSSVDLVVSPSLVKCGDREGENFDRAKSLAKRKVVSVQDLELLRR